MSTGRAQRILTTAQTWDNGNSVAIGHWFGQTCMLQMPVVGWKRNPDGPGNCLLTRTHWMVLCDSNDARSAAAYTNDGRALTLLARGGRGDVHLAINNRVFTGPQNSFFAAAEVVVWNRMLSAAEMAAAAVHLTSYLTTPGAQAASATQGIPMADRKSVV
jgi:hypothetical protein